MDTLPKFQLREGRASVTPAELALADDRPRTRGDCAAGGAFEARPCPFVGCRYNLFLDFTPSGRQGSILYNFPDREPEQMPPEKSCALDTCDEGGVTLEVVGDLINVTRERIRQLEAKALGRLQKRRAALALHEHLEDECVDERLGPLASIATAGGGTSSVATEDEDGDAAEVRNPLYVPGRVPRMGHGDLDAEAEWLLAYDIRTEREKSMPTEGGVPLNPRAVQALAFIRASWAARGRGPTLLEIGDELGVEGPNDAARRSTVSTTLQSLRDGGLLTFSRTEGARVVERPPAPVATSLEESHPVRGRRPRREPRRLPTAVPLPSEPPPPDDPPAAGAARPIEEPMTKSIDPSPKVTEVQQKILDRYEKGEAPAAIATALATTPGTVNSAIHRLRERGLVKRKAGVPGVARGPILDALLPPRARKAARVATRARRPKARPPSALALELAAKMCARITEIREALSGHDDLQRELATLTSALKALDAEG